MKYLLVLPLVLTVACSHVKKEKSAKDSYSPKISFTEAGKTFEANVQVPKDMKDKVPLVVIVPEWWGRNAYVQKRADMLKAEGFAVLAVDMYGDNKSVDNPKDAGELATPFYQKPAMGADRIYKYVMAAKQDPHVDPSKVFVIGYCFGGTQALNFARMAGDVAGVVSFHGNLEAGLPSQKITARVLALNGLADPMVPTKQRQAFEKEMKAIKADYKMVNYKGATHAFTNPDATEIGKKYNIPVAYDKAADEASWKELLTFLRK